MSTAFEDRDQSTDENRPQISFVFPKWIHDQCTFQLAEMRFLYQKVNNTTIL